MEDDFRDFYRDMRSDQLEVLSEQWEFALVSAQSVLSHAHAAVRRAEQHVRTIRYVQAKGSHQESEEKKS